MSFIAPMGSEEIVSLNKNNGKIGKKMNVGKIVKCSKKFQDNRCFSKNKTNKLTNKKLSERSQIRDFKKNNR